ncbi:MAG: hypothetical protein Q4C55_00915, partial [Eubacterium sp.]|nr:hypothetical protein [Eubacterium sp.]
LESLGFDVDAICKYEIGVLLLWPKEGHLPDKLCGIMALMTNEKIPMDAIKAQFPDAKKNWLRFSETAPEARNEVRPSVKRQESWLDNMHKQNQAKAEDPAYKPPKSWIGFKSSALDSGDYVKSRPWAEEEPPAPEPEPEAASEETAAEAVEVETTVAQETSQEGIEVLDPAAKTEDPAPAEEEDDDSKYKWLGFKRTVEEAEEELKRRPIPKFNVPEPEEAAAEGDAEEAPSTPVPAEETPAAEPAAEAKAPEAAPVPEPQPEPLPEAPAPAPQPVSPPAPEPEPEEEIEYLDPSSITNALSAAIDIARDVVGDEFIQEPVRQTAPAQSTPPQPEPSEAAPAAEEEDDDSKYKWLGYKATNLDDDDGFKKGGWKKNY